MPRKGHIAKRDVLPDPIYNSKLVTRAINSIMLDGKKGTAQSILYGAFDKVQELTGREPNEVFNEALENIMPVLEVRSRRIGGQNYQVPTEVRPERRETLGLRWLIKYSRLRHEKTMEERLAKEIVDASNGLGASVKKKDDRANVEQEFLQGGKSPSTVREMMKQKAAEAKGVDPKTKLEKEKSRLEKTIAQLTQRLELVEESLANL